MPSNRKIFLWKGYHSDDIFRRIKQCWEDADLLVLCPPQLDDFTWIQKLPPGEIDWIGEWEERPSLFENRSRLDFPAPPVLGVFTTGTTRANTKLVLFSKINIESCLDGILSFFDTSRIQAIFCYPQPFHVFGLNLGYLLSLLRGYPLIKANGKYSHHFHEQRCELNIEGLVTLGTPTHFADLLTFTRERHIELAPSYSAIIGGAAVSTSLWNAVRSELHIREPSVGYGSTEASPGVTHLPPGQRPTQEGEIGYPLPHLKVEIKEGQGLEFSGSSVCLATIENGQIHFPKKILLHDEIRRREDGVLIFDGRNELILNRGGEKFSLERLETVLREDLGIDALCVALPDSRLGQELGILAEQSGPVTPVTKERVYDFLLQKFQRQFNPEFYFSVAQFPVNENSKVDRKRAREWLIQRKNSPSPLNT